MKLLRLRWHVFAISALVQAALFVPALVIGVLAGFVFWGFVTGVRWARLWVEWFGRTLEAPW